MVRNFPMERSQIHVEIMNQVINYRRRTSDVLSLLFFTNRLLSNSHLREISNSFPASVKTLWGKYHYFGACDLAQSGLEFLAARKLPSSDNSLNCEFLSAAKCLHYCFQILCLSLSQQWSENLTIPEVVRNNFRLRTRESQIISTIDQNIIQEVSFPAYQPTISIGSRKKHALREKLKISPPPPTAIFPFRIQ